MTVRHERYTLSGLYAGEVRCFGPNPACRQAGHAITPARLLYLDHGVGAEAQPLSLEELESMRTIAEAHDIATQGEHDISIVLFEK